MMVIVENRTLTYNTDLIISVSGRKDGTQWRKQEISLAEFVDRVSRVSRAGHTLSEYKAMPKAWKDNAKDVGGYVGGELRSHRRQKVDVLNRQILTLDVDYGEDNVVEKIEKSLAGICYTLHSTHSHTEDNPRFRVLVYPDRSITPDEYEPLMRKVADKINIDWFDDTTYDINRLMFWPSAPTDGPYVFNHNDAPLLSVDNTLSEYGDWRRYDDWPRSVRETKRIKGQFEKQADPLKKSGIVGAFCRTYSMTGALETFLSEVYRREKHDRYTYIGGSTVNGLVIYDDKFCYSNHGSDPARGLTCNAFDIVRIHLFGKQDADSQAVGTRLPSYTSMIEWCAEHEAVKKSLVSQNIICSNEDFDIVEDEEEDTSWYDDLDMGGKNRDIIKPTIHNLRLIFENDNRLKLACKFNSFKESIEDKNDKRWEDVDTTKVRYYLGAKYKSVEFPKEKIDAAIEAQATKNAYHPVVEFLEELVWDGTKRLDTLFIDYLGVEDNFYTREAARLWVMAAVYVAYEPGTKFDYVPVFEGLQGIGKSGFIRNMCCGHDEWFGELTTYDPKLAVEACAGKWFVEIPEMAANSKAEVEQQKSFITATSHNLRPAYGRYTKEYKKRFVLAGSTNEREYLKDRTGNRRWWPIPCTIENIDFESLQANMEQILAEAVNYFKLCEELSMSDEAKVIAKMMQEEKLESDTWEGMIADWLSQDADPQRYDGDCISCMMEGELRERDRVCIAEVWEDCLGGNKIAMKPADRKRIGAAITKTGWEVFGSKRFGKRFGVQRAFLPPKDKAEPF